MSYIVLARKWRPKRFAEMVGQEHVLRALSNSLDSGKVHHAFLFTGTRGVGKTTVARILAKSLNCETGVSCQSVRRLRRMPRNRRGPLRRSHRSRRRLAHQGRRHARTARQRPVRAHPRALQGVPHRRGAHAVESFLQCAVENARGAAAARQIPAGDHRSAEVAGHRAVALPAVQFEATVGEPDRRAAEIHRRRGRVSATNRPRWRCSRAPPKAACAMR